ELASESRKWEDRDEKNDQRRAKREPAIAQHEIRERLISPDQKSVNRIFLFGCDFPANEQRHQHWHECDAKKRGKEHCERFGEGEGTEEPALLCGKRENRDETHCDYEQGEKQRAADAFRAGDDHLNTLNVIRLALVGFPEMLKLLMRVLDHDDR